MDREPIEAQEVFYLTFDQLLELSLQEWKKSLGLLPDVVEADKIRPEQVVQPSNVIKDAQEGE